MARSQFFLRGGRCHLLLLGILILAGLSVMAFNLQTRGASGQELALPPGNAPSAQAPREASFDLLRQTPQEAQLKSAGCVSCHLNTQEPHFKATVRLGCVDCHGGNPTTCDKEKAHVSPRFPDAWPTSGNPVRSYTLLNHESPEFVRFVNPGDLRIAHISCGTTSCHPREVLQNRKSMMTHGCMLWGAALYNNGAVPNKWPRYGESYSMDGVSQRMQNVPQPTKEENERKGILPFLDPLPRFEISQPANILRIFERGGRFRTEVGIPERDEDPGRPRTRLSDRGLGTENRTDPVFIGLTKTRLFDPTLNFLGTNDHPGDYRSSGCTACHVIYGNDRSPVHSGPYALAGNLGQSRSQDPTIPKNESGHPIEHRLTTAIPTSQCMICHMHPGTNVLNSYLGMMWWDEESDAEFMYPKKQKYPTAEQYMQAIMANPDESNARGLWSDPQFLANSSELNSQLKHTQFADFHGHGWMFRAVFKKDRHGNLLDHTGAVVEDVTSDKLQAAMQPPTAEERQKGKRRDGIPVHYMDIHLEKGMHCIDCHFVQDVHGNGNLYGEVRAAIEIQCIDCHGTVSKPATLHTSGPASPKQGRNLEALITPFGKRRFERMGEKLIQNSMVEKDLSWEIVQTRDTIDPTNAHYSEKARLAKTVRFDAKGKLAWGDVPQGDDSVCAHANKNMSCIACHSSWNPSCFGCHLPQKAAIKTPALHSEGDVSRNLVSYDFQTLRDDVYMLARDGDVTGNRIGPARSSCAIHVSSYNLNREGIYFQQQTHSGEGLSGIAFSTNVPHTVRGGHPDQDTFKEKGRSPYPDSYLPGRTETKMCTDCHLSKNNDNNAIMAQLLMHGTQFANFMGRYCWVAAGEHGLAAVVVTERDEPQTVIGSSLHRLAFPDNFHEHEEKHRMLEHAEEHPGKDILDGLLHPLRKTEILQVQNRGEYLYAACGEGGVRLFDIAFIEDKAFAERITTAPVSPCGQQFYVPTKYCTAIAAPSTLAPDPTRTHRDMNHEQKVPALYGELYAADKYEGLIMIGIGTTINGNPLDNFLKRDLTYNPNGILTGARSITIVGKYAYICCDAGLVVVDIEDPKKPSIASVVDNTSLKNPKSVQVQFRYGFVCDDDGVKVLDVTDLAKPVPVAGLRVPEAKSIYVARTYAYVAAGSNGLVILNVENPEKPKLDQVFNADGCINDAQDVKLGITYTSEFAYVADGHNGLRVVQLTSPETPGYSGFSPRPQPELIATYKMPGGGHVINVAKALDRDRAVDENGNQIAVFGRVGARPLNLDEQHKLYLRNGKIWKVSDDPRDRSVYPEPRQPNSEKAARKEETEPPRLP